VCNTKLTKFGLSQATLTVSQAISKLESQFLFPNEKSQGISGIVNISYHIPLS
jgi:hypothetical protein